MDVKTTWLVIGAIIITCINAVYPQDFEDPVKIPEISIPEYYEGERNPFDSVEYELDYEAKQRKPLNKTKNKKHN